MADFELHIETAGDSGTVRLRLHDQNGVHLASSQVKLSDHSFALWQGLFDTRAYVDRFSYTALKGADTLAKSAAEILADLGLGLGQ